MIEQRKNAYLISTDSSLLDIDFIHGFLTRSYWSQGISKEKVIRSIHHALCFGVYDNKKQIGFARVISDFTSFAYLADVFIIEAYRGRKLSKWLMESILAHPDLQELRNWVLRTKDAHGLYQQFGFTSPKNPESYMERKPTSPFLEISV